MIYINKLKTGIGIPVSVHTCRFAKPPMGTDGDPVENFNNKAFSSSLRRETISQNQVMICLLDVNPRYCQKRIRIRKSEEKHLEVGEGHVSMGGFCNVIQGRPK